MQIYNNKNSKLEQIKEIGFDLEKDMQLLTESNLENIFGYEFIKTEFQLNNLRIDSLAFDYENNSFVIIEYKRGSSYSVVDQGMSYLALLLNNKADFVQELSKKRNKFIDLKTIDWSQSKVIIIADSFNRYQKDSINFKDLPIELWELKKFSNGLIIYNPIKASNTVESIKTITKFETNEYNEFKNEIKTYTIDDHFKEGWNKSRELYEIIRDKLLSLDSRLEEVPTKSMISYKIGNKSAFVLTIQKSKIILELYRVKPDDLIDPNNRLRYVKSSMKYRNKHVTNYDIYDISDIESGLIFAKQILNKFFI